MEHFFSHHRALLARFLSASETEKPDAFQAFKWSMDANRIAIDYPDCVQAYSWEAGPRGVAGVAVCPGSVYPVGLSLYQWHVHEPLQAPTETDFIDLDTDNLQHALAQRDTLLLENRVDISKTFWSIAGRLPNGQRVPLSAYSYGPSYPRFAQRFRALLNPAKATTERVMFPQFVAGSELAVRHAGKVWHVVGVDYSYTLMNAGFTAALTNAETFQCYSFARLIETVSKTMPTALARRD